LLCSVALADIDIAVLRLPDPLTTAATIIITILATTTAIVTGHPTILLTTFLGAALLGAVYAPAVRHGMGRGDAHLAVAIGANLGAYSLIAAATAATATILAILFGGATVAALLATKRVRHDQPIPYGVFLLAGALTAILLTTNTALA
jgi:leader peptidase (prepilin peptidase)/N-methyltransferase